MDKTEKALRILKILEDDYPGAGIHLNYETPLELLVATILAAQCTDKKVNEITPALWAAFPGAEDIAYAPQEKLHEIIRPTGFFRQKARSIQGACMAIVEKHGGRVPDNISELVALPGVGRKTANVVLANAYDRQTIPVDTHVKRVTKRLGLAESDNPDRIEQELCEAIPEERRSKASVLIGEHGRKICKSRRPKCPDCSVSGLCDFFLSSQKNDSRGN